MKTYQNLYTLFTTLTRNTTTANQSLGQELINDQHRYLLQKYFDNERTFTTTTVGSMNLTLTGALSLGATSATLSSAWIYPTNTQLVTFSDGEQYNVLFTLNSTAISWATPLTSAVTSAISTLGVQYYSIPASVSKPKDFTVNVGQLKFHPKEVVSIHEWNDLNVLPYSSSIPNNFFIYNSQVGVFPIPSTTGNVITFNYKTRFPNFSFSDYTTGTITTVTPGGTTIVGATTLWTNQYGTGNVQALNLYFRIQPPSGDGLWYPIYSITNDTTLVLSLPIMPTSPTITAGSASYTIGQMPLLMEDFHDMLVYGALKIYFSTIVKDTESFNKFSSLYTERLQLLEDYAGTKTALSVDLGGSNDYMPNPNLFYYPQS